MNASGFKYVYGPVPSRRLGRSLGVDLVPFKTCTYDCIYCNLGHTTNKTTERGVYAPVGDILAEVKAKLSTTHPPDYISLAGSGEPTLHVQIGELIEGIKQLTHIPVAVITNGSLLWDPEVQDALMAADLVIPSLDAGDEFVFRYVNRPHWHITFEKMVNGLVEFRKRFDKPLWLEVFLTGGVTSMEAEARKIASLARRIGPDRVQLNTAVRPTAEEFVHPVPRSRMTDLAIFFSVPTEVIAKGCVPKSLSPESEEASEKDIVALLSRRPCTAQSISMGLGLHVGEVTKHVQALLEKGSVRPQRKGENMFYIANRIQQ
jgi:wyosine [tRNA(Phe)-imidazoG37] synthetase (radical SAM superfamily)